ncbi:unnamed protein product [Candidula unifasciata]|uniref:Receptor ligand binding region domain-containing protein n=1 Tax=Candidula unifasciata TaxID=100452 RepID=A0A8S3YG46_9EUPU|nr:unnamed protein product [Candidula unifasciata]
MPEILNRISQTSIASYYQTNAETTVWLAFKLFRQTWIFSFVYLLFLLRGATALDTFHGIDSISSRTEVKIGVILTQIAGKANFTDLVFAMELTLPAIKIAVEKIESNYYPVLPGVRFVIHEADSNCSGTDGPLAAIDMYWAKEADVYFGPGCTFAIAPVARYSGEWGIPVVTAGALYDNFKNKTAFKTLTRVQSGLDNTTSTDLSKAFECIFDKFHWWNIGFFSEDNPSDCYHTLYSIFLMVKKRYKKDLYHRYLRDNDIKVFEGHLKEAQKMVRSKYAIVYPMIFILLCL